MLISGKNHCPYVPLDILISLSLNLSHSLSISLSQSLIIEKKTWQTATIDKDDFTFSVVYSLLKIKSKTYIFENIFKIP